MNSEMFQNIPLELRSLKQWVLWKYEDKGGRKPTKVPYHVDNYQASTTNSITWSSFTDCFNAFSFGNYHGIGFVFTGTDYSGIDLDCAKILPITGEVNPNYEIDEARQINIFKKFDSYSERSPSNTGCHIIVKGKIPNGKRKNFVEVYPADRFFTMTGDVCNDKPIAERQDMLTILWEQMGGRIKLPTENIDGEEINSDEEILELAEKYNGDKFIQLSAADMTGYPSQSEADQAYMNIIAYYTKNKAQVIRIYSQSKLAQTDKKRKHNGYLSRTVNKAFDLKIPDIDISGLQEAVKKKLNGHSFNGSVAQSIEPTAQSVIVNSQTTVVPPPGLLGEIANFIYAAAPRPVPEIAIAGAIGLMAGICGNAYNVTATGLNQYVLCLAGTGVGKDAAASGIDKIMNEVIKQVPIASDFIGPSEIASGQALIKYMASKSQCFVSVIGEFGIRLKTMSDPKASSSEHMLRRMLLLLYTMSGFTKVLRPSIYADKDKNTNDISSPSFSILAESTPETVYEAIDERLILDGLLPRFIIIEYDGERKLLNKGHEYVQPSNEMITKIGGLMAHCKTIVANKKVITLTLDQDVQKLLDDYDEFTTNKINSKDAHKAIKELWNRSHIKIIKLAGLIAVGVNMNYPIINREMFDWAKNIVETSIYTLSKKFETGQVGKSSNELRQITQVKRIMVEFIKMKPEKLKSYQISEQLYHAKKIPLAFIQRRLLNNIAFKNDPVPSLSMQRAIKNLIDTGVIEEVPKVQAQALGIQRQSLYMISDVSIIDEEFET